MHAGARAGRAPQARRAARRRPAWPTTSTLDRRRSRRRRSPRCAAGGPLPASQLTKLVPGPRPAAEGGRRHGLRGHASACRRAVLFLLAAQGRIARGRPLGSWTVEPVPLGADGGLGRSAAVARRPRRRAPSWPALAAVVRTGRPSTTSRGGRSGRRPTCKAALADVGAVAVTADTGDDPAAPAWVLADDLDDTVARRPAAGLVAARRSTRRSWAGSTGRGTSVRTGRRCSTAAATPGRRSGSVARPSARGASGAAARSCTGCWRTCPAGDVRRIDAAAARLTDWMDGVRVTPRVPDAARPRAGERLSQARGERGEKRARSPDGARLRSASRQPTAAAAARSGPSIAKALTASRMSSADGVPSEGPPDAGGHDGGGVGGWSRPSGMHTHAARRGAGRRGSCRARRGTRRPRRPARRRACGTRPVHGGVRRRRDRRRVEVVADGRHAPGHGARRRARRGRARARRARPCRSCRARRSTRGASGVGGAGSTVDALEHRTDVADVRRQAVSGTASS